MPMKMTSSSAHWRIVLSIVDAFGVRLPSCGVDVSLPCECYADESVCCLGVY